MRERERVLEELLVVEAVAGDGAALEALVDLFHARLVRLATRLVGARAAPDVVQEAWLGVVRGISRLDDPERFRAWVFQVVANKCRDWIRGRARERRALERYATEPGAGTEAAPDSQGDPGASRALRHALAELPPEHRAAVELYYVEQLAIGDIARVLEVPEGTVKSRLFYARRRCRESIERERVLEGRTS